MGNKKRTLLGAEYEIQDGDRASLLDQGIRNIKANRKHLQSKLSVPLGRAIKKGQKLLHGVGDFLKDTHKLGRTGPMIPPKKDSPMNHCNSEMMHSGGWAKMRTINSPGTTGNKEAVKHNDKIMNKIGTFNMPHSPLNKNEFDIDYSGAKPVDLGSISNKEATKKLNTKFQTAKDKWVKGYGGPNNEEYQDEKGGVFYEPVKDRIYTTYLEYPEEADHVGNERFLGKNWDNSPLNESPLDCWDDYERVPGTKEFSKGSCRKK